MSVPIARTSNYRQTEIVSLLRQSGRVAVEDLAAHFGVTLQTIRRDLNEMSEAKLAVRVHGGAIIASGLANQSFMLMGDELARFIGEIGDTRGDHRSAVHTHQRLGVAQFVQVASDRLQGDAKMNSQLLDADAARLAQHCDDFRLAIG